MIAAGLIVAWDASRDATRQGTNEIGMGGASGVYSNFQSFKGGAIGARIENLPEGISYLAVRYRDERGVSGWSNELTVTNTQSPTGPVSITGLSALELAQHLPQPTGQVSLSVFGASNGVTLTTSGNDARVVPLAASNLPAVDWQELTIEPLGVPASLHLTNKGREFFKGVVLPKY